MRLKPVVFACFLVLTANPLIPEWAIAQPTPRPTQSPRCKALSDFFLPSAPELIPFLDTPGVQQASKQVNSLAKLSAHYAAAGLNTKADELAAQAIHRLEQAGGKRDYALSKLFFTYLDLKLYDRAFALFDQQSDNWKTSNLLYLEQGNNLPALKLQANNDPPEPALLAFLARLAHSLPASSWAKVGLLTKIADFYRSPEQTQQRLRFAREALQAAQDFKKSFEPYYQLAEIAALYNTVGDKKQAAQLLDQAVAAISTDKTQSSEDTTDSLTKIAHEYMLLGQVDRAIALLDRAVPLARKSSYAADMELRNIALEYTLAGKDEQALKLIRSIKPTNSIDKFVYSYTATLGDLVLQTAVANRPSAVMRLLNLIQDPEQRAAVQDDVVKQFIALHTFEPALQLVRAMTQSNQKVIALGEIAAGYAKAGQPEKADQTLKSALQVLQSIQDNGYASADVFIELAGQQTAAGQPKQAIALLQQAQRLAESIPPGDYKFHLFFDIANQYNAVGRFEMATRMLDQALQLIQSTKPAPTTSVSTASSFQPPPFPLHDETHVRQLGQLAEQFAKAHQFSKALTIATQLDPTYCQFKAKTLLEIAQPALTAKQTEAADQILSQALKIAQTLDDRQAQFETLLAIAKGYSTLKQQTQADQILAQAQQLVAMH